MLPQPPETGSARNRAPHLQFSVQGRQVRMVLLTWPMIGLLGATVAAATCLLTDCHRCARQLAQETLVGDVGSVKSTSFRPDGTMLSSVGLDGTVMIWDLERAHHRPMRRRGIGTVHCVAFSPDNRLLAAGHANNVVTMYDLDCDATRELEDSPDPRRRRGVWRFRPMARLWRWDRLTVRSRSGMQPAAANGQHSLAMSSSSSPWRLQPMVRRWRRRAMAT